MNCRHKRVHVFEFAEGDIEEEWTRCEQHKCLDCGHWLPLGPANDGGEHAEAVAVEVRAAELADLQYPDSEFTDHEWLGYSHDEEYYSVGDGLRELHSVHDLPPVKLRRWHAGYLAWCIANHDEGEA